MPWWQFYFFLCRRIFLHKFCNAIQSKIIWSYCFISYEVNCEKITFTSHQIRAITYLSIYRARTVEFWKNRLAVLPSILLPNPCFRQSMFKSNPFLKAFWISILRCLTISLSLLSLRVCHFWFQPTSTCNKHSKHRIHACKLDKPNSKCSTRMTFFSLLQYYWIPSTLLRTSSNAFCVGYRVAHFSIYHGKKQMKFYNDFFPIDINCESNERVNLILYVHSSFRSK